jgi:hypothetical protein
MTDPTFSSLWETVDYELHKTINILKGAISVGEHAQQDKGTVLGLVYIALEKVEEAQEELEALRKYHYALEKETKESAPLPVRGQDIVGTKWTGHRGLNN